MIFYNDRNEPKKSVDFDIILYKWAKKLVKQAIIIGTSLSEPHTKLNQYYEKTSVLMYHGMFVGSCLATEVWEGVGSS